MTYYYIKLDINNNKIKDVYFPKKQPSIFQNVESLDENTF